MRIPSQFVIMTIAVFGSLTPTRAVDFLYASYGSNTIIRYDISLSTGTAIAASVQTFIANAGNGPSGLSFDSSGNLFVAASGNNAVNKYDTSGNFLTSITSNVSYPISLSFDPSGSLYVLNNVGNSVSKYDSSYAYQYSVSSNMSSPKSVTNDSSGDVYVLNSAFFINPNPFDNTVVKFNGSTGAYVSTVISNISNPQDFEIDSANNFIVATGSNISKFGPNGSSITSFGSGGKKLALDNSGNVYVYTYGNSIEKYDASGTLLLSWSTGFFDIQGLAVQSVPEPSTLAFAAVACGTLFVAQSRHRYAKC